MVKKKTAIPLLVFCITISTMIGVCYWFKSEVKIIEQSRHYPNKTLIFDDNSVQDGRLVYLVCDKDAPSKCKVVREEVSFNNKDVDTTTCNVSLAVEGVLNETSILVVAFGKNKSILMWEDDKSKLGYGKNVRISVVRFDVCEQTEVRDYDAFSIEQFKNNKKIITYDEFFDVFYKNFSQCSRLQCQLRLSHDGKPMKVAKEVFDSKWNESVVSDVYSIDSRSPDEGIIYIELKDKQFNLYLLKNNAYQEKFLRTLNGEIKTSVVNGSIGACSTADINSNITCWQYNANDGEHKLNVTLNNIKNNTHLISMHTLPKGGFLLSFIDFGRCPKKHPCDATVLSNYFILKIDADGKPAGKVYFTGLDKKYKGIKQSYVYKVPEKEEYCAIVVPLQKRSDKLNILVNCFPMSMFVA